MRISKALFFILITYTVYGQTPDTSYSISTEIGLGFSRYITTMDYDDLDKKGFAGSFKIMWNPEHLLSLGLETGYQYLYSIEVKNYNTDFGITDFSASMSAVPILIAITMKIMPEIKFITGTGMYLLFNDGNLFNDPLESSQISIGGYAGLSYIYRINRRTSLGGEFLYSYISKIQDESASIRLLFIYDFLVY